MERKNILTRSVVIFTKSMNNKLHKIVIRRSVTYDVT